MALRDLAGPACSGDNGLMRATRHLTQDKAHATMLGRPMARGMGRMQPGRGISRGRGGAAAVALPNMARLALQEEAWADEFESFAGPGPGAAAEYEEAFLEAQRMSRLHHEWADDFARAPLPPPLPPGPEMEAAWSDARGATAWAEEFLQAEETSEQVALARTAEALLAQTRDPKLQQSEFMKFVRKLGTGEMRLEGNNLVPGARDAAEDWADEFATQHGDGGEQAAWAEAMAARMDQAGLWADQFDGPQDAFSAPSADEFEQQWQDSWTAAAAAAQAAKALAYQFEPENPFMGSASYEQLLHEGVTARLEGSLARAVLLLEAAAQTNPDSVEAWEALGLCQAENEQEQHAIAALQHCVRIDPARPGPHLALAVSYTNEMQYGEAYEALEESLRTNPRYKTIAAPRTDAAPPRFYHSSNKYLAMNQHHQRVHDALLAAAQASPEDLDPDVQVALGVLFNISGDYDKAVDCFSAALSKRPNDSQLWNKLGATLANSNRSAEAVEAYRKALELRPGYIRARYNIGISCINLRAYREAAEHFVTALVMQSSHSPTATQRNMSETIWTSLKMALSFMDESSELADLAAKRDLEGLQRRLHA
eukprot:m.117768 g.117768  ORF g.117768 m.117768 type:complete len:597 (-) comp14498_c0_seq7:39-1829(-)